MKKRREFVGKPPRKKDFVQGKSPRVGSGKKPVWGPRLEILKKRSEKGGN